MKINIYAIMNGVGLEQDYKLLAQKLRALGHSVSGYNEGETGSPVDIQIHLEHPRLDCIQLSKQNILVPNPEWFQLHWVRCIPRFTEIWCKTNHCKSIFDKMTDKAVYSGFTSENCFIEVPKKMQAIHIAGKSKTKGTLELIEAYRKYDLPTCLIVGENIPNTSGTQLKVMGRLDREDLKRLMSESMVSICPSLYEGWGHYIHEAASCAANIITTDSAPMNEFGISDLVKVSHRERMRLAEISHPNIESLAQMIKSVFEKSPRQLLEDGISNFNRYQEREEWFKNFLKERFA